MTVTTGTIQFRNVSKSYHIVRRAAPRLGTWMLSKALEHFRREPFLALDDLSLRIDPGEMIGLLGSNGAGKSTILKLIAGITDPTSGEVSVSGKVASLLELGVGFHPDLTGIENIFYNGIMMGMTRGQILQRLEQIVAFSGLADFLYEPVKHYSSGMYSRLACSVALHVEPNIILVDEILAVGDAEFQQRGIMRILELHRQGVTVLLVTHETATARDICDRLIWVEEGKLRDQGDPRRIHQAYMTHMMAQVPPPGVFGREPENRDEARITAARFIVGGRETSTLRTGEAARLEFELEGTADTACVEMLWQWSDGRVLIRDRSEPVAFQDNRAHVVYTIPHCPLVDCEVVISVAVTSADGARVLDSRRAEIRVRVETPGWQIGEVLEFPRVAWTATRLDNGDGHSNV